MNRRDLLLQPPLGPAPAHVPPRLADVDPDAVVAVIAVNGARAVNRGVAGPIEVEIAMVDHPLILVLSSPTRVLWRLDPGPRSRLATVIVIGHHGSLVAGVPRGTRVLRVESDELSAASMVQDREAQDESILRLQTDLGVRVSMFQSASRGERFSIQ